MASNKGTTEVDPSPLMQTVKPEEQNVEQKAKSYTRMQWLTLFTLAGVNFTTAICFTLQAPFYPKEAEERGATATEYGFAFSIYELTCFMASPILGKYINVLGPKKTLNVGLAITSIAMFCFGLLEYVKSHFPFIFLSFALRIVEALGKTASVVPVFAIMGAVFPESFATVMGSIDGVIAVAVLVGPTVGALLYTAGGFKLPFITISVIIFLLDLFILFVIAPVEKKENTDDKKAKLLDILKLPSVLVITFVILVASMSITFTAPVLEPHIRRYNLTPLLTGFMFVIIGVTHSVISPIVGRICDKWVSPLIVLSLSMPMAAAGYIFLGPTPHLGIPNTLTLCIIGLVMLGLSSALSIVPALASVISAAVKAGYPNDASTSGVLSGLWFSAYSLGSFLGPSVSGYLYDTVGFEYSTLFVISVNFAMFCAVMILIQKEKISCLKKEAV